MLLPACLFLLAPARPSPADPVEATSRADDYAEQAALDAEALLTGDSREYLAARARLEAHPEQAARALLDRMTTIPAPIDAERKRLLDVLAALPGSDHVGLFVDELRRGIKRAATDKEQLAQLSQWLPLVAAQGEPARAPLTKLLGDRELPLVVRTQLLEAVVDVTPRDRLPELVVLIGSAHRTLRQNLVRALGRRAGTDAELRAEILAAIDAQIGAAKAAQVPALLSARVLLTHGDDPPFTERLRGLALDPNAAFAVRVAALRGLARIDSPTTTDVLADVAAAQLAVADTQAGEVLASIALSDLPAERARPLVAKHDLMNADAPRLSAIAWQVVAVAPDHAWLSKSQDNPWPQVRVAALSRIDRPCGGATVKFLDARARPGGDDDGAAARATVQALGRCGAHDTLVALMNDDTIDIEQRTEAARQLAKHGGNPGIDAVATALGKGPDRRFARRLAATLRHAKHATPTAKSTLCALAQTPGDLGRTALASLAALKIDPQTCEE